MLIESHRRADSREGVVTGLDMDDTQVYQTRNACPLRWRLIVDTKTVLTGFLGEPLSRPTLVTLLAQAGLELWQSPQGFWAIRLKPVEMAKPDRRARRPR